jgi:hypothetical protein
MVLAKVSLSFMVRTKADKSLAFRGQVLRRIVRDTRHIPLQIEGEGANSVARQAEQTALARPQGRARLAYYGEPDMVAWALRNAGPRVSAGRASA